MIPDHDVYYPGIAEIIMRNYKTYHIPIFLKLAKTSGNAVIYSAGIFEASTTVRSIEYFVNGSYI